MPGLLLTTGSAVQCPHGGRALLLTSNFVVSGADGDVLLASDIDIVTGCPFTIGSKYSPCVRIEWDAPSQQTTVHEVNPLVETSVGMCYSAESAVQGTAIIVSTQQRASAQ